MSQQYSKVSLVFMAVLVGYAIGFLFFYAKSLPTIWEIAVYTVLIFLVVVLVAIRWLKSFVFYSFVFFLSLEVGKSFFYDPSRGMNFELRINVPTILLFILMALFVGKMVLKRDTLLLFPKTTIPAFVFILLSALSIVKSPDVALSLFELFRMGICLLIYLLSANYLAREKPNLGILIFTLLAVLIIQSGIGILQHYQEGSLGLEFFGGMEMDPAQWGYEPISRAGGFDGASQRPRCAYSYATSAVGALLLVFK